MSLVGYKPLDRAAPASDPLAILLARKSWDGGERAIGYSYKLADGHFGQAVAISPSAIDVDEKRMTAWIPFADGTRRDRVGDLIEIAGIRTDRHILNPQALLDHGKYLQLPIAQCEDRDSHEYTVELAGNTARANLFFLQTAKKHAQALAAEQTFDLIAKKFLRAGSIGYRPLRTVNLFADPDSGTPSGLHLLVTELLEVSVVVIPANGDTARKLLCLNGVCGKSLSPCLAEPLKAYDPGRKYWDAGYETKSLAAIRAKYISYSPKVAAAMREKKKRELAYSRRSPENVGKTHEDKTMPRKLKREIKSAPAKMPADDKMPPADDAVKAMTDPSMQDDGSKPDANGGGEGGKEKFGAQVLRRIHMDAGILMEEYDEFMEHLEAPEVADHVHSLLEHIQGVLTETEAMFAENYPDLPPLDGASDTGDGDADADDEPEEEPDEETDMATKGFLARRTALRHKYKMDDPEVATGNEHGHKGVCPACGKEPCQCGGGDSKCGTGMATKSVFAEDHRNTLSGATSFLGELGQDESLGEERCTKCMHYHKALKGMLEVKEEAADDPSGDDDSGAGNGEGSGEGGDVSMETKALLERMAKTDAALEETKRRLEISEKRFTSAFAAN